MAEKPTVRDERPAVQLTVAELRDIVREEIEAVLLQARGVPNPLMNTTELAELLRVSERTIASLRDMGLPVTWITPDSPRFERDAVMTWVRAVSEWIAAGCPSDWTKDAHGIPRKPDTR